jgi:hypothetical protein
MIFSCKYDSNGRVTAWQQGSMLRSDIKDFSHSNASYAWALVQRFPKEVLTHDGKWALENLRVSRILNPAVVEVELGK